MFSKVDAKCYYASYFSLKYLSSEWLLEIKTKSIKLPLASHWPLIYLFFFSLIDF